MLNGHDAQSACTHSMCASGLLCSVMFAYYERSNVSRRTKTCCIKHFLRFSTPARLNHPHKAPFEIGRVSFCGPCGLSPWQTVKINKTIKWLFFREQTGLQKKHHDFSKSVLVWNFETYGVERKGNRILDQRGSN